VPAAAEAAGPQGGGVMALEGRRPRRPRVHLLRSHSSEPLYSFDKVCLNLRHFSKLFILKKLLLDVG
jgi:hypothetical protein